MPLAEVVGVVTLARLAGGITEEAEVPLSFCRVVFMVAGHRLGAVLELSPGRLVAFTEVLAVPFSYALSPRVRTVPSMTPTSLAVASSPSLKQSAMSPAATMTPEGGPGGRSGAQPRARRLPSRDTRTIGANILLFLALGNTPSMSEATAEPAAIILSNFETAISLLVTGREDSPRASSPRHRRLHTPDSTLRKQASFGYSPKLLEVVLRSSQCSRKRILRGCIEFI